MTGKNLQRRGLYGGTSCVYCGNWLEDDRHALFYCDFAKQVWAYIAHRVKWTKYAALSFKDLMHYLSSYFEKEEFVVFTTCACSFCLQGTKNDMKVSPLLQAQLPLKP